MVVNTYHYTASGIASLQACISKPRLQAYVAASRGVISDAMDLYTWNTAASAAFYGPLQAVEVALRNAINAELRNYFRRDDWYDDPNFRVTHWIEKWVDGAKDDLTKHMSPITNDNLVAALSFGFWSGLLGPGHRRLHEMRLWRFPLRRAFRGLPVAVRADVFDNVDRLRTFRNRIAHHEQIFTRSLHDDHARIIRVASWLNADLAHWIRYHSRCSAIIAQKPHADHF
jgi:Abi-like protein